MEQSHDKNEPNSCEFSFACGLRFKHRSRPISLEVFEVFSLSRPIGFDMIRFQHHIVSSFMVECVLRAINSFKMSHVRMLCSSVVEQTEHTKI